MNRDPLTSPSRGGISHAQWLRRQFSATPSSGSGESGHQGVGEAWPDLLVDRRSVAERRITPSPHLDTLSIERNNIVSIRLIFEYVIIMPLQVIFQSVGDQECGGQQSQIRKAAGWR